MYILTFPLFLRRALSHERLGETGNSLCPILIRRGNTIVFNLLYLYFRFLGGNKIKKIPEGAFDDTKSLEIMYVRLKAPSLWWAALFVHICIKFTH